MEFVFNDKHFFSESPVVMGILNLTTDSFFDGGSYLTEEKWILRTKEMRDQGAAIIDIGALSTRPGASEISEQEEINRLLKPIKTLVELFPEMIISVDTYRQRVAEKCLEIGACIVNDISGGQFDSKMLDFIGENKIPYILTHTKGTPATMQRDPIEKNCSRMVLEFFEQQTEKLLLRYGAQQIILDPGFGFGKTLEANYELLGKLASLRIHNFPILVGVSRKSMIYKLLQTTPDEALNGTTTINTISLLNGADILRVHDVKQAVETLKLYQTYTKANQ
ncbi:MAG: dihydropteroate synthase [Lentimicrobiaceae bacterium]|jgi:dihydropteroate synthase|nr:dihydropteroate synthase [Lentimicrobiaceae bacterium]